MERCNRTELYQVCRGAGLNPSPRASREDLIQLLLALRDRSSETHGIDLWRNGIKGFATQYYHVLQPQLTCPLRQSLDACKNCLDSQVVACLIEQGDKEHLIRLHRK